MMKTFIFFLTIGLLVACSKGSTTEAVPTPPVSSPPTAPALTYLALGDSYTIGQSVKETERFPAQTVTILRREGIDIANPVYIAQTGWTTGNLQSAIGNQNPAPVYDVVTLLIGVNDQYQRMDTGGYARRFTQLLEKAVQLAKGKKSNVFVLSIPDYSATPFVHTSDKERVRREIDQFNAINRRVTTDYGVSYTDITPSTREAETNSALVANDGLHPSGLEYGKWAELLAPKIKAVLK